MLLILFTWIVIVFVLFSSGDIFISLYNKIGRKDERYNFSDKVFLGLCLLVIPLSIWSLWLPSNHYFLFIYFTVCIIYWFFNRRRFTQLMLGFKQQVKKLSTFQLVFISIFLLLILINNIWPQTSFDSYYYHHQQILWNEQYAVVPGLGNLNDRLAFNSNYLLISSVFSFRFITGDAWYTLHVVLIALLGCWVFFELFKSQYKRVNLIVSLSYILFAFYTLLFWYNTSTDLLSNILIFYLVARTILYPDIFKNNSLLYIVLPVFMVTCKLSVAPICLLCLVLFVQMIRNKEYRPVIFLVVVLFAITVPWLIRNVIVSGYLIYPFYQFDLFSFDWKIPIEAPMQQTEFIKEVGDNHFTSIMEMNFENMVDAWWSIVYTAIIIIIAFVLSLVGLYNFIRKRKSIPSGVHLIAIAVVLILVMWAFSGRAPRFASGTFCALFMLGLYSVFVGMERFKKNFSHIGITILSVFLLAFASWTARRSTYFMNLIPDQVPKILYKPYSYYALCKDIGFSFDGFFVPYPINNGITIYVCMEQPYEKIPSVVTYSGTFVKYQCIRARGYSLQDGFKVDKDCWDKEPGISDK